MPQGPAALAVRSRVGLEADTLEKIPKRSSRLLDPPDEVFRNHVEPYATPSARGATVALGLEDASEVGGDDRQRGRERDARAPSFHAAGQETPLLDEGSRSTSRTGGFGGSRVSRPGVSTCARDDERRGRPCRARIVTQASSASLTVIASIVSDLFVPRYCPTKPSDWSHPARAASRISAVSISASPKESRRCHRARRRPAAPRCDEPPERSPVFFHTR